MGGYAGTRMKGKEKAQGICLCAFPWATEAGRVHSMTSVCILRAVTDDLRIITELKESEVGDGPVKAHSLRPAISLKESGRSLLIALPRWAMNYLAIQVEMTRHLLSVADETNTVVFAEGPHYLLPVIAAKLKRKKIIKYSPVTVSELNHSRDLSPERFALAALGMIEALVLALSDTVLVPPWRSAETLRPGWRRKITSAAICSCIREEFRETQNWQVRDDVVGYIGGLNRAEGALQFARAIPLIVREKNARFLIAGDGILTDEIKRYLSGAGCLERVEFTGPVSSALLPHYLNRMKFHVQPSYYDHTGALNLEAMACGTIVLANGVGGIPHIVADGQTGFLMRDNEPGTIASRLLEVWKRPDLDQVRWNAAIFAREFSCQKMAAAWRGMLRELQG